MKIGISTSVVQRGQTGIAQYVFALLRAFSNLNRNPNPNPNLNLSSRCDAPHQFVLFVLRKDLPLFDEFRDTMQIVPVSECFRPPVLNIAWHQSVLPPLARKHRLDVLHIPSYRRLVHAHTCATVATIHDLAPFHVTAKYDPLRMFYARVIVRRLAQRQHCIIAISRNTARDIFRFFDISRDRVRVIYNGQIGRAHV